MFLYIACKSILKSSKKSGNFAVKEAPNLSQESYTQVNSILIGVVQTPELFEKPNSPKSPQYISSNTMILGHLKNTEINFRVKNLK